ncbi:sensor histidine kinase [Sphingobacterium yanglingense]|uniref:Histidine kinase n=1 Tax=Sphingobacterium yanglingense TaxID=1437280 RepID=A0A4R6WML7_9SPHI|nr:histidine kinase [Sphingobacterium yanglingense]TDQ77301.1 histidine kinase [Sphingobacterium yanglingense]
MKGIFSFFEIYFFQRWVMRCLVSLLCGLLYANGASAQKQSDIEQMAIDGYALRFADTTASVRTQNQALLLAQQKNSPADEAICYAYLAMTNRRLLHLKEFTDYAERSFEIAGRINNRRATAYANWAMGLQRSYIDDKAGAIEYMLKAYNLFTTLDEYAYCAKIGADVSYLFSPSSNANVHKYADEALRFAEKSADSESILHARLAVGSYLLDSAATGNPAQWQKAVSFFKETIWQAEQVESAIVSKSNIGIAHINLAVLYMNGPKPIDESAFLANLEKATQIGMHYNLRNIYRSSLGLRGQFFFQKGNFRTAESLFKEGIAYQQTMPYKDNDLLATFFGCLKELAAAEKDYVSYHEYDTYFNKYNKLKYDEATQKIMQNADARFESEKKQALIEQLEKENSLEKKNKFLGYGISSVLLIGLVFMYRSYYYRQRYYQNREDILQQQQTNSELKVQLMEKESLEALAEKLSLERRLLQSQMDPHFIFNLLGNIQSMILQNDRVTSVSYLGKFAKLTRQVLEQSRMEHILLEEEIRTLKNYIDLQQLRLNASFDYNIHVDETISTDISIPPLLLQPFVENAIEHGLKPLAEIRRGLLEIQFHLDTAHDILECTITDNGIGLEESKGNKVNVSHNSLSTGITNERLALMYPNNPFVRLEVRDREEGFGCVVYLAIPII